jgi:peptidyl-prolyl cis-trans isomerase SurA
MVNLFMRSQHPLHSYTSRCFFSLLLVFFGITSLSAAEQRTNGTPRQLANGIAAKVEGQIITIDQVRAEMAPIVAQIRREARSREDFNQRLDALQTEVIRSLIDRVLIVNEFESRGAKIPQAYLESEYEDFIRREFDNDRARFLEYLRQSGMTPRQFRDDLRKRVIVSVMRQQNRRSAAEISPERIEKFYQENRARFYQPDSVRLRQIVLMPLADEGMEPLRQTARRILSELQTGGDFSDLASRFSQLETRRRGGDEGWITRGDIREELSDIAFSLNKGAYSEAIELGRNIFILYIEDKREEMIQPLSMVREQIENMLAGELIRESQELWLERLRERAFIRIFI